MSIEDLIAAEAAASEAHKDAPLSDDAVVTRGHGRTRTLQVRLTEDELAELAEAARARDLPVSTVARELLLVQLRAGDTTTQAVIARLRSDLEMLASSVA